MYPTSSDPIQDVITHLQAIESETTDKADELDNLITEVTDVKDRLEENVNSISEIVSQLEEVASLGPEAEEASSDADRFLG